jgi:choline dehydrogenase-like flavoprotein
MIAKRLIDAGRRVVMIERGDWVKRGPENWGPRGSLMLTDHYSLDAPFLAMQGSKPEKTGIYECVGGPSVFYGGVSMRFRETDFHPEQEIIADSNAEWPFDYAQLEPYYAKAEQLLDVAGEAGIDPTDPRRSTPYPQAPGPLSQTSKLIGDAARDLGLHPFRLPLAINYRETEDRSACIACTTCDTFACAIHAKNDIATVIIPELLANGMKLHTNTIATRLEADSGKISVVHGLDRATGKPVQVRGKCVVVSAGALGSPHLLLSSGLDKLNPAGDAIGRYLMRHCNAIAYGIFPKTPDPVGEFHKQLGIHDFYRGHPSISNPAGKLGTMQQIQTPPASLVEAVLPKPFGKILSKGVKLLTGLLIIAEDQPNVQNRVSLDPGRKDAFGMPAMLVESRYSERDIAARAALVGKARMVLKKAGALAVYVHKITTFSHSVGTVRLGDDPKTAPLDRDCRFRGIDNLFVVDGSFMPTSAGINPSLTIAANALRVADKVVEASA